MVRPSSTQINTRTDTSDHGLSQASGGPGAVKTGWQALVNRLFFLNWSWIQLVFTLSPQIWIESTGFGRNFGAVPRKLFSRTFVDRNLPPPSFLVREICHWILLKRFRYILNTECQVTVFNNVKIDFWPYKKYLIIMGPICLRNTDSGLWGERISTGVLVIKPTRCTNFSNLFLVWNSTCFGQFLCPSSGVFQCTHINTYRFPDSLRAASCQQTCMTYTIAVRTVWTGIFSKNANISFVKKLVYIYMLPVSRCEFPPFCWRLPVRTM